MLVYHEMHTDLVRPRYIAASKKACFLCYCFIRGYGTYCEPEAHGKVLPQWTVPDKNSYTPKLRDRLRQVLERTAEDVKVALKRSKNGKRQSIPQAQQSLINLVPDPLRSPSVSTLCSVDTADEAREAINSQIVSMKSPMQRIDSHQASGSHLSDCRLYTPDSDSSALNISKQTAHRIHPSKSTEVQFDDEGTLSVSLDEGQDYTSASCRVLSTLNLESAMAIDIAGLAVDEKVTIGGEQHSSSLPLILYLGSEVTYGVILQWNC